MSEATTWWSHFRHSYPSTISTWTHQLLAGHHVETMLVWWVTWSSWRATQHSPRSPVLYVGCEREGPSPEPAPAPASGPPAGSGLWTMGLWVGRCYKEGGLPQVVSTAAPATALTHANMSSSGMNMMGRVRTHSHTPHLCLRYLTVLITYYTSLCWLIISPIPHCVG